MTFIVVAGPLTYYKEIISSYDKYSNIIVSSLDTDIEKINAIKEHFPLILVPFDFNPGKGNLNCQTRTTVAGLMKAKELGATHALKIRSDMVISDLPKFIKILEAKSRISFLTWHTDGYLTDYLNYGPIDDMIEFWNVFEINDNFAEKNLIDNFSKTKQDIFKNFKDISKHVDFFLGDLLRENICIHWIKYNINVSEYYKHNCYLY